MDGEPTYPVEYVVVDVRARRRRAAPRSSPGTRATRRYVEIGRYPAPPRAAVVRLRALRWPREIPAAGCRRRSRRRRARPGWRFPIAAALRRTFAKGYGAAAPARGPAGRPRRRHRRAAAVDGAGDRRRRPAPARPLHGDRRGRIVALLGGCSSRSPGPTAAFVVILAPIVTQHGLSGLLTAGLMAGVLLVVMGVARLGQPDRVHPLPGHHRLHDRHRDRDRDAAAQGRARPRRPARCPSTSSRSSPRSGTRAGPRTLARARRSPSSTLALLRSLPRVTRKRPGAADRDRRRGRAASR